jgi:putative ABC transport system permease protein
MDDIRLAFRRLAKRPGATIASIVTLAFSIGAAAATWALVDAVLLRPLPVQDPDRLFIVEQLFPDGTKMGTLSYPYYPHIRDSGIFEAVIAEWASLSPLVVVDGAPTRTEVLFVSHDYLDGLGVHVPLGRNFSKDDDTRGASPVAILTDRYWRRTFDASPSVLGRTLTIAGKPVTVVGVAAPGFRGLNLARAPEIILPLHIIADIDSRPVNYFSEPVPPGRTMAAVGGGVGIVGKLARGTTPAEAAARLSALGIPAAVLSGRPWPAGTPLPQYPLTNIHAAAVPEAARGGMGRFSTLLGATVGLLLLIGCSTVGMLLLVRTEARRDEFAMCLALGATRWRLARGIGLEGGILAFAGAAAALPVALWLFAGTRAFQLPGRVEIERLDLSLDPRVVGFAIAAALLATLLITILASAFGFSANVSEALRARVGATPRTGRRRTRAALVATQVTVTLVLLAGAGLFARSLLAAVHVNPGVDARRLMTASLSPGQFGYTSDTAPSFFEDLQDRLRRNPAIASLSFSESRGGLLPNGTLVVDGQPSQFPSVVWTTAIDEHYLATLGLVVTDGRAFTKDDREGSPRIVMVSESFGRMIAPGGGHPLGLRITLPGGQPDVAEVVGVVPDMITNLEVLEPLTMYVPLAQHATSAGATRTVTIRAASGTEAARRELMATIRQLSPATTPPPILTMNERLGRQMGPQQFGATVLGTLGVIAILLTVLGTYVLAESMAVLRMREMGIRAALGATRRQLASIVLAETGRLVGLGIAAGLLVAWLSRGMIESFLFRVEPFDAGTLGAVCALILTLALLVSVRPALRAARVDLGAVLKNE